MIFTSCGYKAMLHFVMWPKFGLDCHINICMSVIHIRSDTGVHELPFSSCFLCPGHGCPGQTLQDCFKLCEIPIVLFFPQQGSHQLGVHENEGNKEMSCQVNPPCSDAVPEQELWRCPGVQLRGETEIYLP